MLCKILVDDHPVLCQQAILRSFQERGLNPPRDGYCYGYLVALDVGYSRDQTDLALWIHLGLTCFPSCESVWFRVCSRTEPTPWYPTRWSAIFAYFSERSPSTIALLTMPLSVSRIVSPIVSVICKPTGVDFHLIQYSPIMDYVATIYQH